jgi:hypothetical protein
MSRAAVEVADTFVVQEGKITSDQLVFDTYELRRFEETRAQEERARALSGRRTAPAGGSSCPPLHDGAWSGRSTAIPRAAG